MTNKICSSYELDSIRSGDGRACVPIGPVDPFGRGGDSPLLNERLGCDDVHLSPCHGTVADEIEQSNKPGG